MPSEHAHYPMDGLVNTCRSGVIARTLSLRGRKPRRWSLVIGRGPPLARMLNETKVSMTVSRRRPPPFRSNLESLHGALEDHAPKVEPRAEVQLEVDSFG